jgi:hypothetical protein
LRYNYIEFHIVPPLTFNSPKTPKLGAMPLFGIRGVHDSLFGFRSPLIFFLTDSTSDVKVGSYFTPHIVHTARDQQAYSQAGPPAGTNGWDTDSENLNYPLDSLEQA